MRYVLVHSPVLGPSSWRWVADSLWAHGHEVAVPDLMSAALTGDPATYAHAAAQVDHDGECVIVGHSGAGSIIPSIAATLGRRAARMVFVDAGLPPCEGRVTPSADFLEQLRALAVEGDLPKWSTWWGDGVMESLVPARHQRIELEAEMVEIPLAYFESASRVPAGWCDAAASFLLLSESYRAEAERARTLGWPTIERIGNHLDIANDEEAIADILSRLT